MPIFDRYIAVDWSAHDGPKTGGDSIWIAETFRSGKTVKSFNPSTRTAAFNYLVGLLRGAVERAQKVIVGFDFAFGYPQGAARSLTGREAANWTDLWQRISEVVRDTDDNKSNRFDAAARLNLEMAEGSARYWGHPHQHSYDGLTATKPAANHPTVGEKRLVERRATRAQPVWKLNGVGAVGGQSLVGIPRLQALRTDAKLKNSVAIWPFDTRFSENLAAPVIVAEIFPTLLGELPPVEPRDRAQVETYAERLRDLDGADALGIVLSVPADLTAEDRDAVVSEEGWIVGVGHETLFASVKTSMPAPKAVAPMEATDPKPYVRDPDQVYAQSFATIEAEAELFRLPRPLRPLAVRMIHACGMVDLVEDMVGDAQLPEAVHGALRAGKPVLCDCEMVRAGLIRRYLAADARFIVTLNDAQVPDLAKRLGTTRSAAALELWRPLLAGAIVVIGNAPTALFHLLDMLEAGAQKPAAIIATPVGFVGASESKDRLAEQKLGIPFITVRGRRGGSAIAAAAFNAAAQGQAA